MLYNDSLDLVSMNFLQPIIKTGEQHYLIWRLRKKIGSSINPDISGALITLIKPISELNLR